MSRHYITKASKYYSITPAYTLVFMRCLACVQQSSAADHRWFTTSSTTAGRSVIRGSAAGKAAPGKGDKRKRCKMLARITTASSIAKPALLPTINHQNFFS